MNNKEKTATFSKEKWLGRWCICAEMANEFYYTENKNGNRSNYIFSIGYRTVKIDTSNAVFAHITILNFDFSIGKILKEKK